MTRLLEDVSGSVSGLLAAWARGDSGAQEELWPIVYAHLRRIAKRSLSDNRCNITLSSSDLVHEAYLKFLEQKKISFEDRNHFYAIAAQIMRRILVDYARRRATAKRGGDVQKVTVVAAEDTPMPISHELVAVDDTLTCLAQLDPFKAAVVELRFFGGMTHGEIATAMGCSETTVRRHWQVARAWLRRELDKKGEG